MDTVLLPIEESRVVELVLQLSPQGKRAILMALVPDLNEFEALVDYGDERIHVLAAERGLDWGSLSESERESLIDDLLHGNS